MEEEQTTGNNVQLGFILTPSLAMTDNHRDNIGGNVAIKDWNCAIGKRSTEK